MRNQSKQLLLNLQSPFLNRRGSAKRSKKMSRVLTKGSDLSHLSFRPRLKSCKRREAVAIKNTSGHRCARSKWCRDRNHIQMRLKKTSIMTRKPTRAVRKRKKKKKKKRRRQRELNSTNRSGQLVTLETVVTSMTRERRSLMMRRTIRCRRALKAKKGHRRGAEALGPTASSLGWLTSRNSDSAEWVIEL